MIDDNNDKTGSNINLNNKYVLWAHNINDDNWEISSYKKLCTISTISEFWRLFNNFKKIGWKYMHFYLMKSGVVPIWEHPENKNGGICSFRVEMDKALEVWEDVGVRMMCNMIISDHTDINGISISLKHNWGLIKIWNKNNENNIAKLMHNEMKAKYANFSIMYKINKPDY